MRHRNRIQRVCYTRSRNPFGVRGAAGLLLLLLSISAPFNAASQAGNDDDDVREPSSLAAGDEKIDGPAAWRATAERVRANHAKPNRLFDVYEIVKPYGDLPDKLYKEHDFESVERGLRQLLDRLPDPLAARDYNVAVKRLGALPYLYEPEEARAVLRQWTEQMPRSHFAWLARGYQAIEYAWYWRGRGYAYTVTDEGWRKFAEAMRDAREYLERSYELDPSDPQSACGMMIVCAGLDLPREELDMYLRRVTAIVPAHVTAYSIKLQYLLPKWHGSWRQVDTFVDQIERESARLNEPWLLLIKLQALREMQEQRPGYEKVLRGDAVRAEILAMRERIVDRWPNDLSERAELARAYVLRKR